MAKKTFTEDIKGVDKFFSTPDAPSKGKADKESAYRVCLKLDDGLKDYLRDAAWINRTTVTGYINQLILADKKIKVTKNMNIMQYIQSLFNGEGDVDL